MRVMSWIATFGAVLAALAFAPTAAAHHAVATADVDLTVDGRTSSGAREVTVRWDVGCGPEGVEVERVGAAVYLRDRSGKARLFNGLAPDTATGSKQILLPAGGEFVARSFVDCYGETDDAPRVHRAGADAESRVVRFAPWLFDYEFPSHELCGVRPRGHEKDLQEGIGTTMHLTATFFPALWMKNTRSTRELRVRFSGGGLPRSVRPYQRDWRGGRGEIVVTVKPKRAGRVRMWMEIGGVRTTNKLPIRVLKLPRGCLG
jgi:hypothetical protein